MELQKFQEGPGYFWFALFAVFKPWEHWEAPMPTAPHPSAVRFCLHPDGFWCRTRALHTRDLVPPAVPVHHDIHVLSLCHSERHSENKNCAPHTMHDFASWVPRNLQNSQQRPWIVAPITPQTFKRHFIFCTQLTCTSGNPQHFTAELFSLMC